MLTSYKEYDHVFVLGFEVIRARVVKTNINQGEKEMLWRTDLEDYDLNSDLII